MRSRHERHEVRVVGGHWALTGYAWGLERKAWLLAHEGGAFPLLSPPCRTRPQILC